MFFNDELRESFKKNDENWEDVPTTLTPPGQLGNPNNLIVWKLVNTDYVDMGFHLNEHSSVSSNYFPLRKSLGIGYKEMAVHLSVFLSVWSNFLEMGRQWYGFSPECILMYIFKLNFLEKAFKHILQE